MPALRSAPLTCKLFRAKIALPLKTLLRLLGCYTSIIEMSGTGVLVTCARPAFDRFGVVTATYCIRNERCRGAKRPFSDRAHGPLSNRADSAAKSGGFRITAVQASLIPGLRSPDVFHVRPCCPINTRRFHGARPAGRQIAVCSAAAYKVRCTWAPFSSRLQVAHYGSVSSHCKCRRAFQQICRAPQVARGGCSLTYMCLRCCRHLPPHPLPQSWICCWSTQMWSLTRWACNLHRADDKPAVAEQAA